MIDESQGKIEYAKKEITKILSQLESDTGMIVDELAVEDIDVTTMGDNVRQILRTVILEMKRLPGTRWG